MIGDILKRTRLIYGYKAAEMSGLLHISKIANEHIRRVEDYIQVGEKVTVKVIIVSQGTSKEYIKENVSEDLEKLPVTISGIGTVKVSVYIDGNIKSDEQYWDLNVNNTINIP